MAALHASATLQTAADLHIKPTDDRPHQRHVFLILRGHTRPAHRAAAVRARRGHRGGIAFVEAPRDRPPAAAPVRRPGSAARPAAPPLRVILAKRRGLAEARATRRIELLA
jgi:hypothetical protein